MTMEKHSLVPGPECILVPMRVQKNTLDWRLTFQEDALGCIETVLMESRDFWDCGKGEEQEAISEEYAGYYARVVQRTAFWLGPPDYDSDEDREEPYGTYSDLAGPHYYDEAGNIYDGEPPSGPEYTNRMLTFLSS